MLFQARLYLLFILLTSILWGSGCVVLFRDVKVEALDPKQLPETIDASLRVHTVEGHTLLFPSGAQVTLDSLIGYGREYGLNIEKEAEIEIQAYPLNRIAAVEYLVAETDKRGSIFTSVTGTLLIAVAVMYALIGIALGSILSGDGGTD